MSEFVTLFGKERQIFYLSKLESMMEKPPVPKSSASATEITQVTLLLSQRNCSFVVNTFFSKEDVWQCDAADPLLFFRICNTFWERVNYFLSTETRISDGKTFCSEIYRFSDWATKGHVVVQKEKLFFRGERKMQTIKLFISYN